MKFILEWFESTSREMITGLILIFGLFITQVVKAVLEGQCYFVGRRIGLQTRAVLMSEIYGKSLRRATGVAAAAGGKGGVAGQEEDKSGKKSGGEKEDASTVGFFTTM